VQDLRGTGAAQASRRHYDMGLLVCAMLLMGFGCVMVYSASIGVAHLKLSDSAIYLKKHLIHLLAGLGVMGLAIMVGYHNYRRWVYPILGVSLALLVMIVVGLGITRGHSTRWIGAGFFEFQPSELAKLAFVIYLAYSLEKKLQRIDSFSIAFVPHIVICGLMIVLCLAQPDLGTCLLLAAVMFVMLFVCGTRVSYLAGLGFICAWMAAGFIANSPNRLGRIGSWLNPWEERYAAGYQIVNALTSLGSGGFTGLGLGEGRQKMGFLTQGWTDFIFASVGEELGLIGCIALIAAFGFLCWRGFVIARNAPDCFGRFLAFGITCLLGGQAAFNMGVAVGIVPTKGLNLPLVSGGGSSLVISCLAVGILLNISTWVSAPEGPSRVRTARKQSRTHRVGHDKTRKPRRKPITQRDSGIRTFVRKSGGGS
jgi:cell division protein FtsW